MRGVWLLALVVAVATTGCEALIAEPTPQPGAAATLTRSGRTPIPTPVRTPTPSSAASPSPARSPAAVASPSASPGGRSVTEAEINEVQRVIDQSVATADLPGIEQLLLDRVSLSTAQGGEVLDRDQAAAWLRDHAGPGIKVTRVDRSALSVLLEVLTEGWPLKDPITQGRVTFNLHRYDAQGNVDEDNGAWKIDVIGAE